MNSSMIGKIEKAHRYAREPERMSIQHLVTTFHGQHDDYKVTLDNGTWTCTCHTYEAHMVEACAHIMAIQQLLGPMLTSDAKTWHHTADREASIA